MKTSTMTRQLTGCRRGAPPGRSDRPRWPSLLVAALAVSLLPKPALAQKTDVVLLRNGDRLTGEVKSLYSGRLEYKTDPAKTIQIRWDYVVRLTSTNFFEVVLSTGERRFGALLEPEEPGTLRVGLAELCDDIPLEKVASIERLRTSFWSRLKGSIDVGLSLTKADDRKELNFKATTNYRSQRWRFGASLESFYRRQVTGADFDREDLTASAQRFLGARWLALGIGIVQRNTELALERRVMGVGGAGYHALRTVEQDLIALAGLAVLTESFTDERDPRESVEAVIGLTYKLFALGGNDFTVDATALAYPSLSVKGRFRSTLDVDVRKEVVKDLYLSVRGHLSTDNSTEGEEAGQTDYSLTAAVGWSF
jgi:hypothetical protein